jgi:undecaprenyl-diphosphatase
MPIFQVIVLGIIQGLTEFLPISSTAHLYLLPWLLHWTDPGLAFDIALHAGTLAAVLIYFFRDWVQLLAQAVGIRISGDPDIGRNPSLLWLLALGTVPVGVAGFLFQKQAENAWRNPWVIGTTMIVVGLFLWFAEFAGRRQKDLGHVTLFDSIFIGLAQALAIVPGVSRSGITISTAMLRNLDRPSAARYSFLLATPAIGGAVVKQFWDLFRHEGGLPPDLRTGFAVGILTSAVTGCVVIWLFMGFLRRRSLSFFVWYRIVFGIMVIALAAFRSRGG